METEGVSPEFVPETQNLVDVEMANPITEPPQPETLEAGDSGKMKQSTKSFKNVLVQNKKLSNEELERRFAEFDDSDEEMESETEYETKSKIKVTFSKERLKRMRAPWRGCLIIKLLGENIGFKVLMDKIHRLWNPEGSIEPINVVLGFYILRFETKSDYLREYTGGPWIIQDHYLTVRKWHANFKADMVDAIKTVVWVRIPLLPMEYYDDEAIMDVAKELGKPLKVDENTTVEAAKGAYARVCVEMDLSKPLPMSVAVENFDFFLEYEHMHLICFPVAGSDIAEKAA